MFVPSVPVSSHPVAQVCVTQYQPPDFPLSLVERHHVCNLYLCVRIDGINPQGLPVYCYCGLFLENLLALLKRLKDMPHANPKDFGGIVLCRAPGQPTAEIEEFMRMKFSFARETEPVVLEISRE